MTRKLRGISEQPGINMLDGISYGYIILPSNFEGEVNRRKYVNNCMTRERVPILPERGGTPIFDCFITKSALRDIRFPDKSTQLGSGIVFTVDKNTGHALVFGVLSKLDESSMEIEGVYKVSKNKKDASTLLLMDPESGQIIIESKNKDKPARLKINVSNLTKDCELSIGVSGEISVVTSGDIKVKSNTSITSTVGDSSILLNETSAEVMAKNSINIKAGNGVINIDQDKIKIENQVDNLKEIISDLITQISSITVSVPDPVSGALISGVPINSAAITVISQRLQALLS